MLASLVICDPNYFCCSTRIKIRDLGLLASLAICYLIFVQFHKNIEKNVEIENLFQQKLQSWT